jgi:hypothetical protein
MVMKKVKQLTLKACEILEMYKSIVMEFEVIEQ